MPVPQTFSVTPVTASRLDRSAEVAIRCFAASGAPGPETAYEGQKHLSRPHLRSVPPPPKCSQRNTLPVPRSLPRQFRALNRTGDGVLGRAGRMVLQRVRPVPVTSSTGPPQRSVVAEGGKKASQAVTHHPYGMARHHWHHIRHHGDHRPPLLPGNCFCPLLEALRRTPWPRRRNILRHLLGGVP